MKKITAFLLALVLCLSLFPTVLAEDAHFIYSDDDIEELYFDFEYVSGMVEGMFGTSDGLAYWKHVENTQDGKLKNWLIDTANKIIGEEPDEEYYTQILTNMIALFEYDTAEQIENQGQFDKMKNLGEYALDVVDIGATVIGLGDEYKKITKAIGVAADGIDLALDNIKQIKYYELTIRNYANAENFLKAVNENSENEPLSKAAGELRNVNELLFKERCKYIAGSVESTGSFLAENFLSDMSFSLLKKLDDYKKDSVVKDYVDFGEKAYDALDRIISTGEAVFKAGMLGGDVLFGTTDTFRRHNEMEAMVDISKAIIKEYSKIKVSEDMSANSIYNAIRAKSEYYKMLIATHLRGEYLIYSLTYNDAGTLSYVKKWLDNNVTDEDKTVKKWYNTQTEYCEKYYDMVNEIFERLMGEKFVVEGGFELHNGFIVEIEQKKTVPEGYVGVYSYDDFRKIADNCPGDAFITSIYDVRNEYNTANYILMNDITLPADYDSAGAFYGTLDGNGYTMRGLNKCLFHVLGNATIKNLGLEINHTNDDPDGEYGFGAIARGLNGWNNKNGTAIDNCFVKGSVDIVQRSGNFGGLIGYADGCLISNCYNEADMRITTRQGGNLGGICGEDAKIENCYNTGEISLHATCENTINVYSIDVAVGGIQGYNYCEKIENSYNTGTVKGSANGECSVLVGGILGRNYGSTGFNTNIKNCYNIGNVICDWTSDYDATRDFGTALNATYCAGGILGQSGDNAKIDGCWNGGDVTGEHFVGGIIGRIFDNSDENIINSYNMGNISAVQFAGGIIGRDGYAAGVKYCYNMGNVSGRDRGALAGGLQEGNESFESCYYLDSTGPATPAGIDYTGVTALTKEEMANKDNFVGFDFVSIWKLREEHTQPILKW